jgi:hypothetical protein
MRLKELQQQVWTSLLMQNKFPLLNDAYFLLLSFIRRKSVTAGGHVQTCRVLKRDDACDSSQSKTAFESYLGCRCEGRQSTLRRALLW